MNSIVITGCSSGFGRVTALHLAQQGWRVFATVRQENDRASLMDEAQARHCADNLTVVLCDITNVAQVRALGRTVTDVTASLDGLLNNAGSGYPGPLELIPLDDVRAQLELNLIAHLAVTQTLLPALKAARGAIINVSSQGGRMAFPLNGPYHMSKWALEAMSDTLRIELAPFGVRVVVIEPGSSPTAIWDTSQQRGDASRSQGGWDTTAYAPLVAAIEKYFVQSAQQGFPPQQFADLVLKILNSRNPRARYSLPRAVTLLILIRRLAPDAWWDAFLRRTLRW